ncbi:MAG TPA: LEA type 2 family protein [Chitinophagales bacterium]|nr:LEA type 2 family protein [Chitinophagales bacterium]
MRSVRKIIRMKTFNRYLFFILIVGCTGLASCGDFEEVRFSGIENVQITKLSQQGAEAQVTARIKNPNSTSFTIYKSDLDVSLNGLNAGTAHLTDNVKIKSNSEESYTFRVKSDFSSLSLTDLPQLISIATSKNVKVGLKGNLSVGKFFYKRNIPVEINENVPLSK